MTSEDESATWQRIKPARQGVAASASRGCWSVERGHWQALRPGLPEEVCALLASPIVVSVLPVPTVAPAVRSRLAGLATQVTLAVPARRAGRGTRAGRSTPVRPAARSSTGRQRRAVPAG